MKKQIIFIGLVFQFISILFFSCTKVNLDSLKNQAGLNEDSQNTTSDNIYKGPAINMGNGLVRSWIRVNQFNKPLEFGIEMTDDALDKLPIDIDNQANFEYYIPIENKAKELLAFDHIIINWNPNGHEPSLVFDVPHFDFHFYMISQKERLLIPTYEEAVNEFDNLPALRYRPANYIPTPGGIKQMGKHWISSSFAPPFLYTLIYGSFNGKFIFVEPMLTRDFLLSGTKIEKPYNQPQLFGTENKFYPTALKIYKNDLDKTHLVTLNNFEWISNQN